MNKKKDDKDHFKNLNLVKLPEWDTCSDNVENKTATPLEVFLYENEPAGHSESAKFRAELQLAIGYCLNSN